MPASFHSQSSLRTPRPPFHFALYLSQLLFHFVYQSSRFLGEVLGDAVVNNSYVNGFPTKKSD